MSEWNDVHKKLPEDDGWVLCYFGNNANQIVCYYNKPFLVTQPAFYCSGEELIPTHWMPLPEPPVIKTDG